MEIKEIDGKEYACFDTEEEYFRYANKIYSEKLIAFFKATYAVYPNKEDFMDYVFKNATFISKEQALSYYLIIDKMASKSLNK